MVTRTGKTDFELIAADKIYSGSDGSTIGFIASSSVTAPDPTTAGWNDGTKGIYFGSKFTYGGGTIDPISGSYQEIRYYTNKLSQSVFNDYVMNPQSIEGNGVNGSPDQLAFRASLGGNLYTGSTSIHPKVTGSLWGPGAVGFPTASFATSSTFTFGTQSVSGGTQLFNPNREYIFYDSPPVGVKNRNTDKIKRQNLILPSGSTLSNLESIQQTSFNSQDYTDNLNLLEVAFSPQNEVNNDIIDQIGFFNIGDYIGDPRLIPSVRYIKKSIL